MADDIDRAQDQTAKFTAAAIAAARSKADPPTTRASLECADCGDPIPKARRDAQPGCALCLDCQTEAEGGFWP